MKNFDHIVAVVPAGGSGTRATPPSARPKQLAVVNGIAVVARAVAPLLRHSQVNAVVVAVRPEWESAVRAALNCYDEFPSSPGKLRVLPVAKGSRAQTVAAALDAAVGDNDWGDNDWALVHDAVRPFLSDALLAAVMDAALADGAGAAPLRPVADALKKVNPQTGVVDGVARADLFFAQTPQMFRAAALQTALANHPEAPDECEAMRQCGFSFAAVSGEARNFKLTYPDDFVVAEALARMFDLEEVDGADKLNERAGERVDGRAA